MWRITTALVYSQSSSGKKQDSPPHHGQLTNEDESLNFPCLWWPLHLGTQPTAKLGIAWTIGSAKFKPEDYDFSVVLFILKCTKLLRSLVFESALESLFKYLYFHIYMLWVIFMYIIWNNLGSIVIFLGVYVYCHIKSA